MRLGYVLVVVLVWLGCSGDDDFGSEAPVDAGGEAGLALDGAVDSGGPDAGGSDGGGEAGQDGSGSIDAGGADAGVAGGAPDSGGGGAAGTGSGGSGGTGGEPRPCGWKASFGGPMNDQATSVLALDDGTLVIAGYTNSTSGPLGQGPGAFAARVSETGELMWSNVYPGTGSQVVVRHGLGDRLVLAGTAMTSAACEEHHGATDAWVAEISSDGGDLLRQACIGGDDDDSASDVQARGLPHDGYYLVTGAVDSHDNGNVGPNHNNGTIEATDVLLGYWSPDDTGAFGYCFGSSGPEAGVAFIDDGRLIGGTSGGADGDLADETALGYGDILVVSTASADACTESPCATVVRLGGMQNEAARVGAGRILAGTTASADGDVACPGATQADQRLWVGEYDQGDILSHGCLWSGGSITVTGIGRESDAIAIVGRVNPDDQEDFAAAEVDGTPGMGMSTYLALYDRNDLDTPERIVIVGGPPSDPFLNAVTVRPDGCAVAVGSAAAGAFKDVFIYTRQHEP